MKQKTIRPAARKAVTGRKRRADPVLTEIVRNGVLALTEEMKTNLMRTAYKAAGIQAE